MKDTPKAPAKDTPEPSALERMKDFTRRIVSVPKKDIERLDRAQKGERGSDH